MKIYTSISFDIDGNIISEESYNYDGNMSYCGGGGGGKGASSQPQYAPPPEIAELPEAPSAADESVKEAGEAERKRRQKAAGTSSTILTGGSGLTAPAKTEKKTLLGG